MAPEEKSKIERLRDQRHPDLMQGAFNELVEFGVEYYPAYLSIGSIGTAGLLDITSAATILRIKHTKRENIHRAVGSAMLDVFFVYNDTTPWVTIPIAVYGIACLKQYVSLHKIEKETPNVMNELKHRLTVRQDDAQFVIDSIQAHPLYDQETTMFDIMTRYESRTVAISEMNITDSELPE